jgi:hypothetical protein
MLSVLESDHRRLDHGDLSLVSEPANSNPSSGAAPPDPDGRDAYSLRDPVEPEPASKPDTAAVTEFQLSEPAASAVPSDEPAPESETTFQATSEPDTQPAAPDFPEDPPEVRDVWTRWVDWKEPVILGGGGIVLASLIFFWGSYVAMVIFLAAGLYAAYYFVISMEVPVRVTPEQAIQEFFAAASHRLPNFRRMYGVLTSDGKRCDAFADYGQFRSYWRETLSQLNSSPSWLVPLEFRIEGFKCRYNEDKSMARLRYALRIGPRGRLESARPLAEFDVRNLVVKASDGQWYVNDGTLPEPAEASS